MGSRRRSSRGGGRHRSKKSAQSRIMGIGVMFFFFFICVMGVMFVWDDIAKSLGTYSY
jgi:hypothetical protein